MFYSQFILAKKGPLGTIWIAAHLERKLRKNQVADTDIGVSVDSILFPDVPIALRLSSHLLLGVVRIYSRKVNYLFDDCSEALLKIKQAFRSTAVDLPPEESTAPYHSITLPETFDLDDFELPDSDMFQGNYVDHHISSREQITLQDTMEGVVYSTSQFGPDERFGDGDTSGLDLDEELYLDKVAAAGEAGLILGSDAGLQASVRPMTPVKQAENHVAMTENSETMLASGDVNQIEGGDEDAEFAEYAQAPCTPGLMEEPNLSTVQETSACDDHMESENHNLTEFSVKENLENASSKSDIHHENNNVVDWSLVNDKNPDTVPPMHAEKNGYHTVGLESCQLKPLSDMNPDTVPHMPAEKNGEDDLESSQLKPLVKSPLTAVAMDQISENNPYSPSSSLADQVRALSPTPELSDKIIATSDGPEGVEVLENGTVSNERGVHSVEGTNEDSVEPQDIMLGESTLDMSTSTRTCQPPVLEVSLENNQDSLMIEVSDNVEIAGSLEKSSESNRELDDRPGHEKLETQVCQQSKVSEIMENALLPCTTTPRLNQPDSLNPGGDSDLPFEVAGLCSKETSAREEGPHVSGASTAVQGEVAADCSKQVLEENHDKRPDSCEGVQERNSKPNDQVDEGVGDECQLGNLNNSTRSDFPAPEKLLSVPEGRADVANNFLVEATPDKEVVMGFDGAGALSENVSGKKRSFTESTLTVQSLYSVESLGVLHTKGTADSIPDDNDLLSSILVGRRSSALKVKPTPSETTSMKRPRSAPRTSTSKRKVLMDDSMVLHGDTIRQQLTNTEDIRRVRKKAPCTRPEISMIQKQSWEDEIFSEPVLTGVSMELASLHNQTYDLSEIRVSQCDVNDASFEAAADPNLIALSEDLAMEAGIDTSMSYGPDVTKETGINGSTDPVIFRDEAEVQLADTLLLTENQQCDDQTVSSEIYATQVQINITSSVAEPKSLQHELSGQSAEMEMNGKCISDAGAVNPDATVAVESSYRSDPVSGANELSAGMVQLASFDRTGDADASLHIDEPGVLPYQMLDMLPFEIEAYMMDTNSLKGIDANEAAGRNDDDIAVVDKIDEAAGKNDDEIAGVDKIDANEAAGENGDEVAIVETESRAKDEFLLEETEGGSSVEIRPDIQPVANPSATYSPEIIGFSPQIITFDQVMEEISKNDQGTVNEDTILDAQVEYNAKGLVSNGICGEQDSLNPTEVNMDLRNASFDDGENPDRQEAHPPSMTEAGISATDLEHHDDFDYSTAGHDTEFLNFDDDEEAEVDGDSMPSAEETRFLENSGWSSRTRAVANYLQTLFEKEAERGRKVLPIDNLLAGKTRKEASRMFFEALVLKTKDYVHVEQKTPFDNINIYPRLKLLKSDF